MLSRLTCCLVRDSSADGALPALAVNGAGELNGTRERPGIAFDGGGDYFKRAEVRQLLQDLQHEQPQDLEAWLRSYGHGERGLSARGASRPTLSPQSRAEASYEMLDWRFFLLNKEKEIFNLTRRLWTRSAGKSRITCEPHLHAFLPRILREAIAGGLISMEDQQKIVNTGPVSSTYHPVFQRIDAAVVLMDASGFTALTEALARQTGGAEEIGIYLNGFFGPLIDIVTSFGGDILKFGGDAITILWPVQAGDEAGEAAEEGAARQDGALAAVSAACRCCLEVQARVESFGKTPLPGNTLTLHIGVGFGSLCLLQLGGLVDRWEYCAAGAPIDEVSIAEPLAKPGETVLSASVSALLAAQGVPSFELGPMETEGAPPGYTRLLAVASGAPADLCRPAVEDGRPRLAELDSQLVKRYIPQAVRGHLKSCEDAEMRRIAVIFLAMGGLSPAISSSDAGRTQLIMRLFQRSVYALEGSINKFDINDKGMVLLAVFGLPPVNHFSDDPIRAVLTAMRLCDTLHEEGVEGRAGVATGTCWCGVVGTSQRREYTVLGDVVNLAARLMGCAAEGAVLVDEATHEACRKFLEFESLGGVALKGKSRKVDVFQFTGRVLSRFVQSSRHLQSQLLSWDEWPVKAELHRVLEAQLHNPQRPRGIVFVKGGPGCGKTEAVTHVGTWAKSKQFALLFGQNMNPTSTFAVPRLCWQEVFGALMEAACEDPYWQQQVQQASPGRQAAACGAAPDLYQLAVAMLLAIGADQDDLSWAPLLSFVIPGINFGAKGVSALLERDEQRSSGLPRLARLCTLLLESFTAFSSRTQGTVVLVHIKRGTSVHHESYVHDENIARAIGELCITRSASAIGRPLILCVVSRQAILKDAWLRKQAASGGGLVQVGDLSREDTEHYMAHLLRASGGVAEVLVDYVYDTCGGNPFSVEVLSRQLESVGVLQRTGKDHVELAPGAQLQNLRYPEDLEGMARASFEKLPDADRMLLKTAAVCCEWETEISVTDEFSLTDLALHMGVSSVHEIEAQCMRLVDNRIIAEVRIGIGSRSSSCTSPGSGLSKRRTRVCAQGMDCTSRSFKFVSKLLQHVASTLVLEAQKRTILSRATTRSCASQDFHRCPRKSG